MNKINRITIDSNLHFFSSAQTVLLPPLSLSYYEIFYSSLIVGFILVFEVKWKFSPENRKATSNGCVYQKIVNFIHTLNLNKQLASTCTVYIVHVMQRSTNEKLHSISNFKHDTENVLDANIWINTYNACLVTRQWMCKFIQKTVSLIFLSRWQFNI